MRRACQIATANAAARPHPNYRCADRESRLLGVWWTYLYTVLQGIATGGLGPLTAMLLADYYGRQHLRTIYGLLRAIQVLGFALGPLMAGMAFDTTQSYHGAFVAFPGLSLVGTVLIGLAQPPKHAHTAA